jgi:hypothetical protein
VVRLPATVVEVGVGEAASGADVADDTVAVALEWDRPAAEAGVAPTTTPTPSVTRAATTTLRRVGVHWCRGGALTVVGSALVVPFLTTNRRDPAWEKLTARQNLTGVSRSPGGLS